MSMITEFVKKLRLYASEYNESPLGREIEGTSDLLKEAADIIEELSAKLASANMNRSEQYYKGNSEFVEKLRGRLKRELQLADEDKRKADVLQFDRAVGYANGMDIAIDILNKLAEEYKDVPDTNVGKNFSEKLIEQISKKKEYHKDFYEKMGCTEHDKDLHKATQLAFDECMEIVGELSKEYKSNGWIPVSEHYPDTEKYILLSFSNFSIPVVGRWEEDENGGAFYVGDEQDSCVSQDLYVNAWQPLPQPYEGE